MSITLDRTFVKELENLVSANRLEEAINAFKQKVDPLPDNIIILEAKFTGIKQQYNNGLIEFREFTLSSNQCNSAFLSHLKEFKKEELKDTHKVKFNPHHQFTCDRSEQYNTFTKIIDTSPRQKIHFFYLFGGEAQKHESIFTRFVNRLKGIEHLTGYDVIDVSINITPDIDLRELEREFSYEILKELGNPEASWPSKKERSLAHGLLSGTRTQQLQKTGKVLFHLNITDALWDAHIVPEQTINFIQNFCLKEELLKDGPEVFFFFSIEYSDENQKIRGEVGEALNNPTYLKSLGELKMVTKKHIDDWFLTYKKMWDDPDERKETQNKYFKDDLPEMFMSKVQLKLKKVINEINDEEKYDQRR